MIEISIDDIKAFNYCPKRYQLNKKNDIFYDSKGEVDQMILDSLIGWYYIQRLGDKKPTLYEVDATIGIIISNIEGYRLLDSEQIGRRKAEKVAIKNGRAFAEYENKKEMEIILQDHPFTLPFSKDLVIKDKLPLVRKNDKGELELVIFKANKRPIEKFYIETSFEITIYDWAFREIFNKSPDSIIVYHVPKSKYYRTSRKTWQYKRALDQIGSLEQAILEDKYPLRETFLCDTCFVRRKCVQEYFGEED